jgi:hypothetical protein
VVPDPLAFLQLPAILVLMHGSCSSR